MILIKFTTLITLLLLPVKGDDSNRICASDVVIERNMLAMNLTIADQKTEICALKARLERLERLHDVTTLPEVNMSTTTEMWGVFNKDYFRTIALSKDELDTIKLSKKLCEEGWVHFQRQCYYFSKRKRSWDNANTSCEDMGGHLATVDSKEINIFIRNYRSRFVRFWIGGRSNDTNWQWAGTGSALEYTAWCPEQPDGKGVLCLSFLKLVPPVCFWTDRKCRYREAYICQRPVKAL
ncbi:type-2 ice-structuring protein-like [Pecten maximus]|uniref:type-2 ice-structuring protein-like n=1 Tax=Pecten maximus TaxID=6579 RepID=UPI001458905B|nr:type-2 ice-structuring protein-like [Pecten maximus]